MMKRSRCVFWLPWVLVLVGFSIYLNTLPNEFVFDDEPHIVLDENIRSFSDTFANMARNDRPLVLLSLAVNYAENEEGEVDAVGYHAFNMFVHLFAGLALFGVVGRTLRLPRWEGVFEVSGPWIAFTVALLWVCHPLNTQAVTYVIQRGESMMGMFFLLSLYAAIRQWGSDTFAGRVGWTGGAIAAGLLGAMSKQVMVVLPVVLLVYDWVFVRESVKEWVARRGVLYVGLFSVSGALVVYSMSGIFSEDASSAGFNTPVVSPWGYLISQPAVILHYLRLSVWPHPLVLDYMWLPAIPTDTPADQLMTLWMTRVVPYAAGVLLLLGVTCVGVVGRRWWGFLGAAFFLILAPTSSIMPIADLAFEHRMYLPLTCVVTLLVVMVGRGAKWLSPTGWPVGGAILVVIVALSLGLRTIERNFDYRSRISIWDSVVVHRPSNPRGWHNLGAGLSKADRSDEALYCYERALAIVPHYAAAHNGVAGIYMKRYEGAADIKLKRYNLKMAVYHYDQAVKLKDEDPAYHYNLGRMLSIGGVTHEAELELYRAIELQPQYPNAYNNLGNIFERSRQFDKAIDAYSTAIQQKPSEITPYIGLVRTFIKTGQKQQAEQMIQQARQATGQSIDAESVFRAAPAPALP